MKRLIALAVLIVLSSSPSFGAKIYLKDGTLEATEKVWEKNGYIYFILKGTKNVEIRYAKEIVARIENNTFQADNAGVKRSVNENADSGSIAKNESQPSNPPKKKSPPSLPEAISGAEKKPEKLHSETTKQDRQNHDSAFSAEKNVKDKFSPAGMSGIGFYDPRRPIKYWADPQSRHHTLKAAVNALARQYGQTSAWVIANMGKANDLGIIHQNLTNSIKSRNHSIGSVTADEASKTRPIESHMVSSSVPQRKPPQKPIQNQPLHSTQDNSAFFYNPRNSLKYWSDESTGHPTLEAALHAIAEKYHRTPKWVEENMGEVNDLDQIHRNLRKSLQQ